uniref:G-protein coupled receptors family 1 profile domain-containing protein n=1 Tax=Panagrolaimus sp. JU765 TaxID=591449 RepID=A0AC34PZQ7_9BILA
MSFLSCFDRFISVTYPTKYLRLTPWYGYSLTFITFASSLPTTIASGIIVYQTKNVYDTNAVCVLQNGVPDFMFFALRGIRIIASCTGTMLYIFIGYKIFRASYNLLCLFF